MISTNENNEGGLWELGVAFPIINPCFERFEKHYTLAYDVEVNQNTIILPIVLDSSELRKNSLLFIGPSTDQTRDISGNVLYYGKSESFLIQDIVILNNETTIYFKAHKATNKTVYAYVKGDIITVRAIASSWKALMVTDISGLNGPLSDDVTFSRYYSLDDDKGFSQMIRAVYTAYNDANEGVIQHFNDGRRSLLNRLGSTKMRMSAVLRVGIIHNANVDSDPLDEIIAGTKLDDIDEGVGYIDNTGWDIDDENFVSLASSDDITAYLRLLTYTDPAGTLLLQDESVNTGQLSTGSDNILLTKIITLTAGALSGKIAVYAAFPSNISLAEVRFAIDNVILEHCKDTTKEDDGFYQVDMNPAIGGTISTNTQIDTEKNLLGIVKMSRIGDPNQRYTISVKWINRDKDFIEDMRILEKWNKEGHPIVLRTKMSAKIPGTLLCNMIITSVDNNEGSPGTSKSDISITFNEIAI